MEDPYGTQIISLDPSFCLQSTCSCHQSCQFPEFSTPYSPQPSLHPHSPVGRWKSAAVGGTTIVDDDDNVPGATSATVTGRMGVTGTRPAPEEAKFPGATGLRYTQMIIPGTRTK